MPSAQYRHPNTRQGKGAGNAQKTGTCHNCGKRGHWARECRSTRVETNNHTTDWASTTVDFVRAGNSHGLNYIPDRWLVDSASTCLVANEFFPEFFNLREADISIRVGGGNDLPCNRIADMWVKGASKPILLVGVRIVPGFGVNILSGPYLEQKLGMTLRSNGRRWSAENKRGHVAVQGPADDAGLYWCKLKRLPPPTERGMPTGSNARTVRNADGFLKHQAFGLLWLG